jgi:pyruvate formate lyase activating enzyme
MGKRGMCIARLNKDGELYAESFARVTSISLDPIEKKPLRHFHPGSLILSLGSYGCNFRCDFCQNHEISMGEAQWQAIQPEEVAALSLRYASEGNIGVAFTYNEPLIGYEYVRECAALIHGQGQKNVLVTNGFINPEPLEALLPLIDAMNIDLKGFTAQFYKDIRGKLEAVKATIAAASHACHVEVTTLVIPGKNDSAAEMESLAKWISSVDQGVPLHITRFFPRHRMSALPPTPLSTLLALTDIAKKHLPYVHLGNC